MSGVFGDDAVAEDPSQHHRVVRVTTRHINPATTPIWLQPWSQDRRAGVHGELDAVR